jgi:serine/threonine-protein kinase
LEKDRNRRYQTMAEVAAKLEGLLQKSAQPDNNASAHTPISEAWGEENKRRGSKGRTILAHWRPLIMIALVILALGAVGYKWFARKAGAPGSGISSNGGSAGAGIRSVAVLPFKPLSEEGRDEYLEMGLADALIGKLSSSLRHIVVRPTSAVRKYTDPRQDALVAGRELKAEAVLDGYLQKLGDRVRVTARLVRVDDGRALWSATFDEGIKDVLILEDAMSERVASALVPALTGDEKTLLAKHYTDNSEAYRAYLVGRYFWNKRTGESLSKGVRFFKQAIDIQPDYALAHAGLADCYLSLYGYCIQPAGEVVPLAKAAATRALELDDALAEAHTSQACILFLDEHNWQAAESEFLRAIALNPNYATARHWYSVCLGSLGRLSEALVEMQRAQDIDPLSPSINTDLGELLYFARDYDKAVVQIQKTLDKDPDFLQAYWALGNAYERNKMYDQSASTYEKALQLSGLGKLGIAFRKSYLVYGYSGAMRMLLDERKKQAGRDLSLSHSIARYYAALGDSDRAFEWLEKAYQSRNPWLINMNVEPQMDGLRSDPRFASLLRRMGIPQS